MICKVRVENYKSIPDLVLDLGRVTVLIGANGSGKTNILEAITLAAAATQNKLDNEFLTSRGVRVTETRFMRSAFDKVSTTPKSIKIAIQRINEVNFACELYADETGSYPIWKINPGREFLRALFTGELQGFLAQKYGTLPGFLVYAPENSALRTFQAEGQILPLGIRGEGLFAHLKALQSEPHVKRLGKIKDRLTLIDWFDSFDVPENLSPGERSIRIRDRFLPDGILFDQRSANEGFLYLLFYITLFISPDTPSFFSIDNIDTCLNPKLCTALLQQLAHLAKEYDKQVIFTTHNPAVLDGLNLHDEEQRLLVVDRNKAGHTRVHRVDPPKPFEGQPAVSLSEAFMRGYIGGLPKNF